jgi:signal peptidase II
MNLSLNQFRILFLSLAVLVLDQVSKLVVRSTMSLHESIPVLGNFFKLTYIENAGMAFGISISNNTFFTMFAVVASITILVYLFKMKGDQLAARLALAIILGGAIGNLTDRIIRGSVVDFFDFEFFNIHIPAFKLLFFNFPGYSLTRWPVFNVADMAVSIGMLILLVFVAFEKESVSAKNTLVNDAETEMIR